MERNRSTLKSYFETGDYPNEAQFADLIDSFLSVSEDDASIGNIAIAMNSFSDGKSFSVYAPGSSSYVSMDSNGWSIFGNVSANDGQDSHLIIKRNGGLEFNDRGTTHKVWHAGNDGNGSGLDADTVDGLQANVFVRNDGGSGTRFSAGYLQFNGDGAANNDYVAFNDATNGFYFNADTSRQNTSANANVYAGEFFAGGAYYYGDNKKMFQFSDGWLRLNPSNDFSSGIYCASSIVRTDNQLQVGSGGDAFYAHSNGDVRVSGAYLRSNHNTGYLEGSYNNVGGNGAQSNPIYVIGSGYVPSTTSLGNMYGIGFAHGSQASFLNSTDLGTNPANWGLYIAADGNARIFLNATSGIGYFNNVVFASNFILNSDGRIKEEVEDVKVDSLPIRWRKFKMRNDEDKHQRYGVIAQELEEYCPDFVRTDEEGNKSVAYIDLLVAKNAELEARLEKMEEIIKNLK